MILLIHRLLCKYPSGWVCQQIKGSTARDYFHAPSAPWPACDVAFLHRRVRDTHVAPNPAPNQGASSAAACPAAAWGVGRGRAQMALAACGLCSMVMHVPCCTMRTPAYMGGQEGGRGTSGGC